LKFVLLELLREYCNVEAKFQHSSFDQSVLVLLANNDPNVVLDHIHSHMCVSQKNFVALQLMVGSEFYLVIFFVIFYVGLHIHDANLLLNF